MKSPRVVIVGGGAAGFFAALSCAEANPNADVTILERGAHFLSKVKISGGGRCNVTHACFDIREFITRYPRGEQALISPFHQFQAGDTVAWFEKRGVKLKAENDGRMFPVTDSSQTIIDCLVGEARSLGVKMLTNCGVEKITRVFKQSDDDCFHETSHSSPLPVRRGEGGRRPGEGLAHEKNFWRFELSLTNHEMLACDKVLLATGGCRSAAGGQLAVSLGHTLALPVPSLFTFHVETPWLRELAGVSLPKVEVAVPGTNLRERGALLVTHWGLSGPAILRLSAWGARAFHACDYKLPLLVNWLPQFNADSLAAELQSRRDSQTARAIVNSPIAPIPSRLWAQLVLTSGISESTRWPALSRALLHGLVRQLLRTEFHVSGKSLNKDEFVTCGGVPLSEVNFKTMESRICPGLFFAGELLDVDGITGGFNFQAAWTTGWIAGREMAR